MSRIPTSFCACGLALFPLYIKQGTNNDGKYRGLMHVGSACAAGHSHINCSVCSHCGTTMLNIGIRYEEQMWLCGGCNVEYITSELKRRRLLKRNGNRTEPWGWLEPNGKVTIGK